MKCIWLLRLFLLFPFLNPQFIFFIIYNLYLLLVTSNFSVLCLFTSSIDRLSVSTNDRVSDAMNEPQPPQPQPPAADRSHDANLRKALAIYKHEMSSAPLSPKLSVEWAFAIARFCALIPEDILSHTIPPLANCLTSSTDSGAAATPPVRALQIAAVHCLSRIACLRGGSLAAQIAHSGAIAQIVKLLQICESGDNNDGVFVRTLVKCLWILVSFSDECRLVLKNENGLQLIFRLLTPNMEPSRTLVYLMEILTAMAMVDSVRDEIYFGNNLQLQVLILAIFVGTIASRERACQALGLLAASSPEKRWVLARLGTMNALVYLFKEGDDIRTKLIAANALGVILSDIDSIRTAAEFGAIPVFVELLEGSSEVGREIAEDAFCMLSVSESNAISIADQMVRILKDGNEYAKESAVSVLWDIVVYKHDAPILINSGAFPVLLKIVGDDEIGDGVKEMVLRVIGLSSSLKKNRAALVDDGAISVLVEIMKRKDSYSYQVRQYASRVLKNFFMDDDYFKMAIDEVGVEIILSESDDYESDSMDVDDSDDAD